MAAIPNEKTRLIYPDQLQKNYETLDSTRRSLEFKACCRKVTTCVCWVLMPCSGQMALYRKTSEPAWNGPCLCCDLWVNGCEGRCCEPDSSYLDNQEGRIYKETDENARVIYREKTVASALSATAFQQTAGHTQAGLIGHVFEYLESPPQQTMNL
ncbi:MAG TPA: hypothetical protein VLE89_07000 [Chlamydiales bacterium]|nr:hypothetical protein [Chlamydiales bacterium]